MEKIKMSDNKRKRFYHIQYINTGKTDYIETDRLLVIGRIYTLKDGQQCRVVRQAHFKYTFSDIENIYSVMSQYNKGSLQYGLAVRLRETLKSNVPAVRFSDEDREMLYDIYVEDTELTDEQREAISKVLNINNK
jgi:hypothetical protein